MRVQLRSAPGDGRARFRGRRLAAMVCLAATVAMAEEPPLGPGDMLDFDIFGDGEPSVRLLVGADGAVAAPLLGPIEVSGLTVGAARAAMEQAFVAEGFLTEPRIALSVASYRDVYVIGDVRASGAFAYRPGMTVEQALALAGGLGFTAETGQGRALTRAALEAELAAVPPELTREAAAAARLAARVDGRDAIAATDLPSEALPGLDSALLERLRPVEHAILTTQLEAYSAQKEAISAEIAETESELALLAQRAENQQTAIASAREEADRIRALIERGIRTVSEESRLDRMMVNEEGLYLAILAQMSQARSRIASRRLDLTRLETQWREGALLELQERRSAIAGLMERRAGLERRLVLLAQIELGEARPAAAPTATFRIRRIGSDSAPDLIAADGVTAVAPGDVVIVQVATEAVAPATGLGG